MYHNISDNISPITPVSSSWNAPGAQLFRQERKAEVSAAGLPTKDKKQGDV